MEDLVNSADGLGASMHVGGGMSDQTFAHGSLTFEFTDADGKILHCEEHNTLTTVGLNLIANSAFNASAYTAAFYMGLITTVGFSALSAADTMASHAGWNEVANTGTNVPPYGVTRPTVTYGAASGGIVASGTQTFVFTGAGTVEGAFVVGGSGASATVANTSGVLTAEGTLSVAQPVVSGNTLVVTHSVTL